jgi:hypothetical protein
MNDLHKLSVTYVQPPPVVQRYSHRNGESEPPSVSGVYWTYNEFGNYRELTQLAIMPTEDCQVRSLSLCGDWKTLVPERAKQLGVQWWGPVAPPWDEVKP